MDYLNPYNPYGNLPEMPDMKDLTPEEQEMVRMKILLCGCLTYIAVIIIGLALCAVFSGCTTPKSVEQHHHHYYQADTLAVQAAVDNRMASWHQQIDSAWHERMETFSTELYNSSRETEVTTETVTIATDSLGRTLRTEQRTISRDISREQRQMEQRLTQEYETRLRVAVDSLSKVWQSRYDHLQAHWQQNDSTALTKTPAGNAQPWYRKFFGQFHYFINGFLIAAVIWLTRKWWLRPILKKFN